MDAKTLEYVKQTAAILSLGLELFNQASTALNRIQQINSGDPITDAELDALRTEREGALDRLAKQIGR